VTAISIQPVRLWQTWHLRRGHAFYVLSLATLAAGYYAYWGLWLLKMYYFAWAACLLLSGVLVVQQLVRVHDLARSLFPIAVWYGYLALSGLWSPDPMLAWSQLAAGMLLPTVFVVCRVWAQSTSPSALAFYFQFQFLMNLALIVFFLAIYGTPYGSHGLGGIRTGFAYAAITALPYAIWQMRRRPSLARVFVVVSAAIVCLTIGSRSTIVLLPIALLGSLVFIRRRGGQTIRAIVQLSMLGVAVAGIAFAIPGVRAGMMGALARFDPSATRLDVPVDIESELSAPMTERTDIERRLSLFVAGRSFFANPIIGGGYYSTLAITRTQFNIPIGAHGLPSVLFGELGIVGAVLFSWLIVRFFRGIRRGKRHARSIEEREFFEATTVTMVTLLLFGLFHQVDQTPAFFALLAWAPMQHSRL
jgi:hypothetical protein